MHLSDPRETTPTVTVRGEAILRAEPDEAMLWITLTALEDEPGRALADVSRRGERVAAMLDELGVAKRDRSTTGATVSEEFDHTDIPRPQMHRASIHLASAAPAGPMPIEPGEHEVTAAIEVTFALELS
jgi:uncharacterized protein YggE